MPVGVKIEINYNFVPIVNVCISKKEATQIIINQHQQTSPYVRMSICLISETISAVINEERKLQTSVLRTWPKQFLL